MPFSDKIVTRKEFYQEINNLYNNLHKPIGTEYEASAQKLYTWLIQPIKQELEEQGIENLVFSLDRCSSHLPLAALVNPDTGDFLIEEGYSVGLIPQKTPENYEYEYIELKDSNLTFLGNTNRLPGVKDELERVQNIWAQKELTHFNETNQPEILSDRNHIGFSIKTSFKAFMGKEFTKETLTQILNFKFSESYQLNNPPRILHIATHSVFNADNPEESYLELGNRETGSDNYYSFSEFKQQTIDDIELFVLSSCEAIISDDITEKCDSKLIKDNEGTLHNKDAEERDNSDDLLGFAGLAHELGAKAALGTLWDIDDRETPKLMERFYINLSVQNSTIISEKGKVIKAEALREAQVYIMSREDTKHPYYWAAFSIVGSPW